MCQSVPKRAIRRAGAKQTHRAAPHCISKRSHSTAFRTQKPTRPDKRTHSRKNEPNSTCTTPRKPASTQNWRNKPTCQNEKRRRETSFPTPLGSRSKKSYFFFSASSISFSISAFADFTKLCTSAGQLAMRSIERVNWVTTSLACMTAIDQFCSAAASLAM